MLLSLIVYCFICRDDRSTVDRARSYQQKLLLLHPFVTMFTLPSLSDKRGVLPMGHTVEIDHDTAAVHRHGAVLFQVTFQSTCEDYVTRADCERDMNAATNSPLCTFDNTDSEECSLAEPPPQPPESLTFTMIVALLAAVIVVPVDMLLRFYVDDYAFRRPDPARCGSCTSQTSCRGP